MSFLGSLFNPTKNTNQGFGQAISLANKANERVDPFLNQSLQTSGAAQGRLADLLNINGTAAQAEALNGFTQGPAAQANLDAGIRAVDQSAAARGMSLSGDNLAALQQLGQTNYNNEYQTYLNRLSGLNNGGFQAAGAISGNANNLGNLYIGQGQSKDAGNQAGLSNALNIAGFVGGRLF